MTSVSVIIPTYNRAHLLPEAIESVLSQDVADCSIEIIVVDDGSTDETPAVMERFSRNVRYLRQRNGGAGVARNRGISEAYGDWVAFLDSDDKWLPFKLSLQLAVAERLSAFNVIYSDFYTFDEKGIVAQQGLFDWYKYANGEGELDWLQIYGQRQDSLGLGIEHLGKGFNIYTGNIFRPALRMSYASCWTMLIRREALSEHIRFAEHLPTWEDYWFLCRLAEEHDFVFMDIATAANRAHTGPRLTDSAHAVSLRCHIDVCKKIYLNSTSPHRPGTRDVMLCLARLYCALAKEDLKGTLRHVLPACVIRALSAARNR